MTVNQYLVWSMIWNKCKTESVIFHVISMIFHDLHEFPMIFLQCDRVPILFSYFALQQCRKMWQYHAKSLPLQKVAPKPRNSRQRKLKCIESTFVCPSHTFPWCPMDIKYTTNTKHDLFGQINLDKSADRETDRRTARWIEGQTSKQRQMDGQTDTAGQNQG